VLYPDFLVVEAEVIVNLKDDAQPVAATEFEAVVLLLTAEKEQ
jgi:hypothetical protein